MLQPPLPMRWRLMRAPCHSEETILFATKVLYSEKGLPAGEPAILELLATGN